MQHVLQNFSRFVGVFVVMRLVAMQLPFDMLHPLCGFSGQIFHPSFGKMVVCHMQMLQTLLQHPSLVLFSSVMLVMFMMFGMLMMMIGVFVIVMRLPPVFGLLVEFRDMIFRHLQFFSELRDLFLVGILVDRLMKAISQLMQLLQLYLFRFLRYSLCFVGNFAALFLEFAFRLFGAATHLGFDLRGAFFLSKRLDGALLTPFLLFLAMDRREDQAEQQYSKDRFVHHRFSRHQELGSS